MSTLYTQSHEWLAIAATTTPTRITIGITNYGQDSLGEIVFAELPRIGQEIAPGQTLCVVESVKAASEILSPIKGIVERVNDALSRTPQLINRSPEKDGWLCTLRVDPNALPDTNTHANGQFLNVTQYKSLIGN